MANSVVKDLFIEEMVSSGRTIEEAEQDWLQYLEDMADYRAHKYGVSDAQFWGICQDNPEDWEIGEDLGESEEEAYEAALKEAHQEFDLILSAIDAEMKVNPLLAQLLETDGKRADREFELDDTIPF